jgi:hypothetical protein
LDWWQKSMQTTKHKTYLVLAGYDVDAGQELKLRREMAEKTLQEPELLVNLIEVSANNEIGLAQKIYPHPHAPPGGNHHGIRRRAQCGKRQGDLQTQVRQDASAQKDKSQVRVQPPVDHDFNFVRLVLAQLVFAYLV